MLAPIDLYKKLQVEKQTSQEKYDIQTIYTMI